MAMAASSPSQLWFRCSIEMSDSAKRKNSSDKRRAKETMAIRRKKERRNKRSDVGHVDRRRTNSDRSCSTERRKRLVSMAIVSDVRARESDDDDLRVQTSKKKRNATKNHLNIRIGREKNICEQRLEKKQMSNTLTFSDMQTEIPRCKWISMHFMKSICRRRRKRWRFSVTRWYNAVREDREEQVFVSGQ